jgi:hypothetical protein
MKTPLQVTVLRRRRMKARYLIRYERGRAPCLRGGELDFLDRAVRRAELDHPERTSTFELYFHALEDSLGLRLPRPDFAEGEVRAAYWAEGQLAQSHLQDAERLNRAAAQGGSPPARRWLAGPAVAVRVQFLR